MALEDYKEIVGGIAGILTIGQLLSGVLTCKKIYNSGSTKNFQPYSTLFLAGFLVAAIMFLQGLIINDRTMKTITFIALTINLGYNTFYYLWSDTATRNNYLKNSGKAVTVLLSVLFYIKLENPEKLPFRYGILSTLFMFAFFASPLINIKKIIRTKNSESIPFLFAFMGALRSSSWLLYGFIINQPFILLQNFVFLNLCIVQLTLLYVYPSKPAVKKE